MLSKQYEIYRDVFDHKNIFITGPANCGKSYILNRIINELTIRGKNFQVTSPNSLTAVTMHGLTIHRFLRITPSCRSLTDYIEEYRTKSTRQVLKNLDILIIDDIGAISVELFQLLSDILDFEKEKGLPFGGIQVILAGDLLQLGPFTKERRNIEIFETSVWTKSNFKVHKLYQIMLGPKGSSLNTGSVSENDTGHDYFRILNKIRIGQISDEEMIDFFGKASERNNKRQTNKNFIYLFGRNAENNERNQKYLDSIEGNIVTFEAQDIISEEGSTKDISACIAEKYLILKEGVDVILLHDFTTPLDRINSGKNQVQLSFIVVNHQKIKGSVGHLIGFSTRGLPCIQFGMKTVEITYHIWEVHRMNASGVLQVVASRRQIPLSIAAGFTIHKAQNFVLENVVIDCEHIFGVGQFYTACSRVRSEKGLYLQNFNSKCIKTNYKSVDFDNLL